MAIVTDAELREGLAGRVRGINITLGAFVAIAWYNCIELIVLIFVTFERYEGNYFWSLLIGTVLGVIPHSVGYLLLDFGLTTAKWLFLILICSGWWIMITAQSLVLYSRLHFVYWNPRGLRLILAMIIANVFILIIPTIVLTFCSNYLDSESVVTAYNIMERIQIIGISIQESIMSMIYIIETNNLLKLNPNGNNRKTVLQLLIVNLLFIAMDASLIALEFARLHSFQTTFKAMVYSIKLKLEFAVLRKLVHIVNRRSSSTWKPPDSNNPAVAGADPSSHPTTHQPRPSDSTTVAAATTDPSDPNPADLADFVDQSQLTTDITHATHPTTTTTTTSGTTGGGTTSFTRRRTELLCNSGMHQRHLDPEDIDIALFEHSDRPQRMRDDDNDDGSSSTAATAEATTTTFEAAAG